MPDGQAQVAAPVSIDVARRGLDPRSKILLVLIVSLAVMSPGGLVFVPAGIVLATGLAVADRAWSRAVTIPVTGAIMYLFGWVFPLVWANPVVTVVAIGCGYLIRFVAAFGVGAHLIATTSPTQLSAALRAWHLPRALSVTLAVMLRFFPVVATESAAVLDAMRLRGLAGATGLTQHPILTMERFTVPMIAASLRASEDLSASAILRGLGSRRTPVALDPPRFGWPDLLLALALIVLAAASLLLPSPLTTVIA
ncbi:energy-coupling factor transporter transmembrane component T [Microbacterium marinilacus]|uniref:energy-coupling factor transporter transmembrane component T n=1 Tax=Microbacterium marinilacus TaxID=415209 RepID=UPI001C8D5D28|nr:energy-coupling factor transporter transmembrane component T [Microbacterium marinilacus]MBY0687587.1 energy-coupling factor transporter transmembrane protein EcfT [Microbacterium marinilacus]